MTSSRTLFLLSVLGLASACSSAPGDDASSVVGSGGETANTPGTGAGSSGTTTVTPVGGSGSGSAGSTTTGGTTTAAMNVLPVSVNGTQCAPDPSGSYPNKPCVTVTVCVPGTSTCQTIPDILLDTGSFGLRVFHQVLTIPLTKIATSGGTLTECVQYGGGMSDWGPIARADVVLGGEPAVTVPMQIIDSTFGVVSASACPNMEVSPTDAQMNGVLGVGVFAEDCGPMCTISASNHLYYSCTGSACTGVTVPLSNQVTNPVTSLPIDNNGLIVQLPAVSAAGAPSVEGSLVLGIGTRGNNAPSGTFKTYQLDGYGEFSTTFGGTPYDAYLDTGSNGLFFGPPSTVTLPTCLSPYTSWFCPTGTQNLTATLADATARVSGTASFQIANSITLLQTSSNVFPDLGGPVSPSMGFDWGLPFYLGKSVYEGFDGGSSAIGSGPYVAF